MDELIKKLNGANMDIDLATPKGMILWEQDRCPWNEAENTNDHKCAIKNVSICRYFCGIEYLDTLLCCYPHPNPLKHEKQDFREVEHKWHNALMKSLTKTSRDHTAIQGIQHMNDDMTKIGASRVTTCSLLPQQPIDTQPSHLHRLDRTFKLLIHPYVHLQRGVPLY